MAGPPEFVMLLGSAVLALILAFPLWGVAGYAVTVAHEGGHALITLLLGGRVDSVLIGRGRTGKTYSEMHATDHLFVLMAGYVAPSAFGLAAAVALAHGRPDVVLWASVVLLVLLATTSGNPGALACIVCTGLLLFLAVHRGGE